MGGEGLFPKVSGDTVFASEINKLLTPDSTSNSMSDRKITNVGTPTASGDAVNKSYVDAIIDPLFNTSTGHDHDGSDSKNLDWDNCWTDSVHTHADNDGGGTLDNSEFSPIITRYWSAAGCAFNPNLRDADQINRNGGSIQTLSDNVDYYVHVDLPDGAIVTACIVYADTTLVWTLQRSAVDSATDGAMATANTGTEDTSISNATIDNQNYSYGIGIANAMTNDYIYGARITYTISEVWMA